jgi:signal transduction histidine kinase
VSVTTGVGVVRLPRWIRPPERAWPVAVGVAVVVLSALAIRQVWPEEPGDVPAAWWPMQFAGVFATVTGTILWLGRPHNRIGPMLIWLGATWYLGDLVLMSDRVLGTAGYFLEYVPEVAVAHLLIALPSGRLTGRLERILVAVSYATTPVERLVQFFWQHRYALPLPAAVASPRSGWTIAGSAANIALTIAFLAVGARRWASIPRPVRRPYTLVWPVMVGMGWVSMVLSVSYLTNTDGRSILFLAFSGGLLLAPAIAVTGLVYLQLNRTLVADLVVRLSVAPGPEPVRAAMAEVLGDPTVELYRCGSGGGYVNSTGGSVKIPPDGRALIPIGPNAVLVYDAALLDQPRLIEAVAAAAWLALDNAQLQDVRREVSASRARLVAAMDGQRHRIQRDLHDGAQHKLLAVSMLVERARGTAAAAPAEAGDTHLLTRVSRYLHEAIRELRVLVEGVYPPALSEQGLAAALEGLAERAPVPVDVAVPARRWPERVERTAYFVVAEALSNVYKHSGAGSARVRLSDAADRLVVEVLDEGIGGADPAVGTGLRGLQDRVAGLDGTLRVDSPPGDGTRLVVELPCD